MSKYNSENIINELIADVTEIIDIVNNEFILLDNDVLHFQLIHNKWSVNQCLQHLNITGYYYLPKIKTQLETAICSGQKCNNIYNSGWIGEMTISNTKPKKGGVIPKPMRTFKKELNPIVSKYAKTSAIPEFIEQQNKLIHYLRQAKQVDLNKNKITSLTPILRFRLGDALRFFVAHEQRHILQAKNTLKELKTHK